MTEINIDDKQKYLNENYPFDDPPALTDMRECIHCGNVITVGDFKVFREETGEEYICCPYTPNCNGTVIDWLPLNYNRK